MAHFDTEYQRLEASYSDSPPGEENLLVHVPEGSKCKTWPHISQESKHSYILWFAWFTVQCVVMSVRTPNNGISSILTLFMHVFINFSSMAPHWKSGPVLSENILFALWWTFLLWLLIDENTVTNSTDVSVPIIFTLTFNKSIISTRRMDLPVCSWEKYLSLCRSIYSSCAFLVWPYSNGFCYCLV